MVVCPKCKHYKKRQEDGKYPQMQLKEGKGQRVKRWECPICGYSFIDGKRKEQGFYNLPFKKTIGSEESRYENGIRCR